ncbi:hypothetical protein ACFQJD_14025 [Haloplanus sp. GCM10025708]|uniref:hypothetical protein n=1 Tax=Haloferacaceae TaxID=1644056 RepID=UPI00360CCFA7
MTEPDPNDPLSPYFPSETPDVPGNGRTWVALALALTLLLGAAFGVLSLFVTL